MKKQTLLNDHEDTATILAALRLFQKRYENCDAETIRADWPEHFDGIAPLGTADIDDLCERINHGRKAESIQFVELVARMKTEEEFGEDAPPTEDFISTLNELIVEARKVLEAK